MTEKADWKIKEGDDVRVYFENVERICGTVRYTPQATGDCWVIESLHEINYVQTFSKIVKDK